MTARGFVSTVSTCQLSREEIRDRNLISQDPEIQKK